MSFPLKNFVGNHKSARPIVYKGVRYPSRRALAAALGIDGKEWYSQKEIAEACGVSTGTIKYRLKEGKDISPDLCGRLGKACEYQGKRYPSISSLACELGIYPSDARSLVENDGGWL